MHQELVEERRWISEARFFHALNYCMLLPGPEAQQLAIYVGWLLHRTVGGLVAGVFFVLPAVFVLLGLSWLYVVHGNVPWVAAIFYGLRAAVIAVVAAAVLRIGARALKSRILLGIAAAGFAAILVYRVPFPVIITAAALVGLAGARLWPRAFATVPGHGAVPEAGAGPSDGAGAAGHTRPTLRRAGTVLIGGLLAWWGPLLAVILWRGWHDVLAREAIFFSKAAMVTFGGAYAVLAYISQAAVEHYHWLDPGEMPVGLGLAESTPGPLILVTQSVGFVGAYRQPAGLDPLVAGALGAAVTVWATFAPCLLWIFLGAPFIERLRGNVGLSGALSAITAAVVGVVLNLAVWLGLHTLFRTVTAQPLLGGVVPAPAFWTLDPVALALATVAFIGMWKLRWGIVPVVGGSALIGLLLRLFVRA